jgi:hypothetical protein
VFSSAAQHARQEWQEGHRRLQEAARDPLVGDRLHAQLDAVVAELRRRLGETFTLAQLADAYSGSEDWAREVVSERAPVPDWPRTVALATDAAFYAYARGAVDYRP